MLVFSGCVTTPTGGDASAKLTAMQQLSTVVERDSNMLGWFATGSMAAGILSYVFNRHLPWNGHTWKAFIIAGTSCLIARWVLAYATAWLGVLSLCVGLTTLIFLAIFYGRPSFELLWNTIRGWCARKP